MTIEIDSRMRSATRNAYGGPEVLTLGDVATPSPAEDEILIRVHASSVNPADWHVMKGSPWLVRLQSGLRRPKRPELGTDVAGVVVAVGSGVTEFAVGDAVWGGARGAYAEYALAKERTLVPQPEGVGFATTGAIAIAGLTALQGLRHKAGLEAGDHALIIGASGGVGTYAVQIAKADGAEVTAVVSGRNVQLMRELGADHVVDYETSDFAATDVRYDAILDNVGLRPFSDLRRILKPTGTYVLVSGPKGALLGPLPRMLRMMLLSLTTRQRLRPFLSTFDKADLEELSELVRSGEVRTVFDRRYGLPEIAEAMRHQGEGHAQGKTVIVVRDAEPGNG